ncbi:DEAD/DEAH box helicase [Streptomyces roseolus]|uniref:DEAD/DEAH box helicase n=1 Tax=Streptomyces roseolus TaxID=67358 RepID=UPI001674C14C|nr:DEAD/DEAH box helicase [Streptomyces roseolus]
MIQLREHQKAGLDAIQAWLGWPHIRTPRPDGERATYVSATGSGKTYTAAAAAREFFPRGRVLVMVPTLDLLAQTAQAWRRIGHTGPMVAVCSLYGDEVLDALGVRVTTNPIQLALWAGAGPVVVFATYASLVDRDDPWDFTGRVKVRGPLETALAGGERMYGQRMDGFDLAVVDEAHGTAGDAARPWAAIHDNTRIPAAFRLYMTATPRILAAPRPGTDGEQQPIVSMTDDPDGTYGAWIHELGLSEAITREILAGFEIDVLEIRDPDPLPAPGLSEEALRGRRLALLQTALLEHAARHNLKTVMTFHHRVEEAEAFAAQLPRTAAELHANEPSLDALAAAEKMPASSISARLYDLDPGRHVPPGRVWSAWLCGDHKVTERRQAIEQFANGIDATGHRVHRAFLASVRVLGEGIDITGERGVEAVCFADARGSQVELVQNIGRALRPRTDGTAKTARIIVPVFLQPGEDPKDMVASASYEPLVAVLNGLRAHSEHLVSDIASSARTHGTRTPHVHRDDEGNIIPAPGPGRDADEEEAAAQATVESALLRFAGPRDPATIAAFLRTRVYRPESLVWLEGYQALRRWRAEHGLTGLVAVPYDTVTTLATAAGTKEFPLGRWVHQQRKSLRAGTLEPHRKTQLDAEGMVWEPGDEAWETKLAALRSYHRAHGHLAPRQDAVWGETDQDTIAIGQLIANLRRPGALGKDPDRAATRAEQLTEIDRDWNCPWPLDWQRHHRVLARLAADEPDGKLPDIAPGVVLDGDDLGRWITRQRRAWPDLFDEQRARLTALGITPPAEPVPATREMAGKGKMPAAFRRGLAALAQFTAREGAGAVPARGHTETLLIDGEQHEHKLGVWYGNTKQRRDKLNPAQRTALADLGVTWA